VSSTSVILSNSGSSSFRNVTLDATTTPAYPSSGITWRFKSGNTVTSVFSGMMHIKAVCRAPVVVESDATPVQARVAFNSPQVWNNNVLARNLNAVNAAGSITVFQPPVNSTNVVYSGSTANRTLYWVGGAGSWGDPFRWSTSSGGNGGACIPTANDDVFFDANSGLGSGRTVAVTAGLAFCRGMNWTGIPAATATVLDLGTYPVEVNGSLTLAPGGIGAACCCAGQRSGIRLYQQQYGQRCHHRRHRPEHSHASRHHGAAAERSLQRPGRHVVAERAHPVRRVLPTRATGWYVAGKCYHRHL
jgi:hypothetical protein